MEVYSHSRLSCFEQCKLRFKLKYIDKLEPEVETTIEAHLGSVVHSVLEWLYIQVKKNKIPSIEEIINYYSEVWEKDFKEEIRIINGNAEIYFNKGIEFIINYYMKHCPFDDGTLEIEKKIHFKLDESEEYLIQGFIDRLVYNKETGEYEVHDYKTANNLPRKENIENDRQLALYSIAVKELFGQDKEVILVWHYLAHNMKICSKRTNKQLEQLKKETIELIKKIESTENFPTNKGILCNWCDFKSMCSAWGGKLPKKDVQMILE
ncbi:RecB family exonuclease [Nanoarchaeota archaeon]